MKTKLKETRYIGSEVIELLNDGLEFELLLDRTGSYSKSCTLSIAPDIQNPRGHLQQEKQGSPRTTKFVQTTETNCCLCYPHEVTEIHKSETNS